MWRHGCKPIAKPLHRNEILATGIARRYFSLDEDRQAREQAAALARRDNRFAVLAQLFVGGTAIVIDAISHLADRDARAFMDGHDPLEYLRTRGLLSPDCGCLSIVETISVDEAFLLGGQIPLGVLLDMCAQFLDTLEEHFALFPEIPDVAEHEPEALSAPAIQ